MTKTYDLSGREKGPPKISKLDTINKQINKVTIQPQKKGSSSSLGELSLCSPGQGQGWPCHQERFWAQFCQPQPSSGYLPFKNVQLLPLFRLRRVSRNLTKTKTECWTLWSSRISWENENPCLIRWQLIDFYFKENCFYCRHWPAAPPPCPWGQHGNDPPLYTLVNIIVIVLHHDHLKVSWQCSSVLLFPVSGNAAQIRRHYRVISIQCLEETLVGIEIEPNQSSNLLKHWVL